MSYSVKTAPAVDEVLGKLPLPVRIVILRELARCAESPTKNARRSAAREPGMVFRIEVPYDDMTAFVDAYFQFEPDEQGLFVWRLSVEFL